MSSLCNRIPNRGKSTGESQCARNGQGASVTGIVVSWEVRGGEMKDADHLEPSSPQSDVGFYSETDGKL